LKNKGQIHIVSATPILIKMRLAMDRRLKKAGLSFTDVAKAISRAKYDLS
jgi:hypothetical protein